eukprot:COSAG01_NODE_11689_length_1878_cov_144.896009_2_plen_483_part_01
MSFEYDIIKYYEDGGNANTPAAESAQMKQQAVDWQRKLKDEFYGTSERDGNPIGRQGMYLVLKRKHPNSYPTKRFVGGWLRRQMSNQINRGVRKVSPSIQSVIVSKPNDLIQIDYMYFYRNLTGGLEPNSDDLDTQQLAKIQKLLKGKVPGCITAIDCFSRVGYAYPVPGNINSNEAWKIFKKIRADAEKRYKTKIKRVQTDKGSEFMKTFRKGLKGLAANNPGFYRHSFGYTGRSQTQGLVERFNGTLKRMIQRNLNFHLGNKWTAYLNTALEKYNTNPHSTIKMAPYDVDPTNYAIVKENIIKEAKKKKRSQDVVYKPGDLVRIKIYKPKRLTPNFTYKDGPLYEMTKRRKYEGVYMINKVNATNASNKIGKAPTYTVIAHWSKESNADWYAANSEDTTLPSGITLKDEVIDVPGSPLDGRPYKAGSYGRKFLKDELVRVPTDKKGEPIADGRDLDIEDDEELVEPPPPQKKKQPEPEPFK